MIGLDTNVFVRYLAGDPDTESQVTQAIEAIDQALRNDIPVFINHVVICETIWVLLYHYKTNKSDLIHALDTIFKHPGFHFESRATLKKALDRYQNKKADFADCLIDLLNRKQGCTKTLSFDKQAINDLNFQEP